MDKRGGHRVEPAPHACVEHLIADDDADAADQALVNADLRAYLAMVFRFQLGDELRDLRSVDGERRLDLGFEFALMLDLELLVEAANLRDQRKAAVLHQDLREIAARAVEALAAYAEDQRLQLGRGDVRIIDAARNALIPDDDVQHAKHPRPRLERVLFAREPECRFGIGPGNGDRFRHDPLQFRLHGPQQVRVSFGVDFAPQNLFRAGDCERRHLGTQRFPRTGNFLLDLCLRARN